MCTVTGLKGVILIGESLLCCLYYCCIIWIYMYTWGAHVYRRNFIRVVGYGHYIFWGSGPPMRLWAYSHSSSTLETRTHPKASFTNYRAWFLKISSIYFTNTTKLILPTKHPSYDNQSLKIVLAERGVHLQKKSWLDLVSPVKVTPWLILLKVWNWKAKIFFSWDSC